jgi:p-hydroxybenzoate 3-monooxygenase
MTTTRTAVAVIGAGPAGLTVAGCDGAHGVTQGYLPPESTVKAHHDYGIGWLALLAEAIGPRWGLVS